MSNRRKSKRTMYCVEPDCHRVADIRVYMFDDDGTDRGSSWWCRTHAVEHARNSIGRIWADKQCTCGEVDRIIEEAGRSKSGDLDPSEPRER